MTESAQDSIFPIVLDRVRLTAGDIRILKDLVLTLNRDEGLTIVLGPNGAGKSLLLRVLHGLLVPHKGRVTWGGGTDPGLSRQRQTMVFQRPVLLRRTVHDNIDFALKLRLGDKAARRKKIAEMLEMTGLTRFAERPARRLSFGEQQRLALARALSAEPELLILDEPCANLDPAASHLVESILQQTVAGGTRVIMATHDLNQARRLADNVIFMYRGHIKERREASAFFAGPENDLAAAFLRGELLWWKRRSLYEPRDGLEVETLKDIH